MSPELSNGAGHVDTSDGEIPPLARELLTRLDVSQRQQAEAHRALASAVQELRGDVQSVRGDVQVLTQRAPDRTLLWVFAGLWILTLFSLGLLALRLGVDPRPAAEAVRALTPSALP